MENDSSFLSLNDSLSTPKSVKKRKIELSPSPIINLSPYLNLSDRKDRRRTSINSDRIYDLLSGEPIKFEIKYRSRQPPGGKSHMDEIFSVPLEEKIEKELYRDEVSQESIDVTNDEIEVTKEEKELVLEDVSFEDSFSNEELELEAEEQIQVK